MESPGHQITEEEYRRIGRQLYSRFRKAGLRPSEIEDLVQETFLFAQRQLNEKRFRMDSSLDTWIVGIGKKRMGKFFRFRSAKMRDGAEVHIHAEPDSSGEPTVTSQLPSPDPGPEHVVSEKQTVSAVMATLGRIPAEIRLPFVLKVTGHSIQEISERLGIPLGLVTSRVHQVRAKLRQEHEHQR